MTFERAGEDTFGSLTKLQLSSFSITVRQFYLPPILTPIWNLCHSSFWYCKYKCFAYTLPIGAKQRPVLSWNRRWRWTHFWSLERWGKTNKKKKNFRHLQLNVSLYKFKGPCVTHMTYNRNFCVSRLVKAFVNLLLKPSEECSLNENVKHKKKKKKWQKTE